MPRFAMGVTRLDKIKNTHVRGTANAVRIGKKVRETRLRWYGHVLQRNAEYVGKRVIGNGFAREEEKRETSKEVYGRSEGRLEVVGLQRKIQKIGPNGEESSAVATPNGTSRKEKKRRSNTQTNKTSVKPIIYKYTKVQHYMLVIDFAHLLVIVLCSF